MIRFLTFEQYHGKANVGSTKLRVHNLIKYWPEAGLYKYGENPEALIFQKVYCQPDYKFPAHFPGIKILDICDPDWMDHQNVKETVDAVDGVTVPTEALAEFLRQLTDKPVRVIPDRHDMGAIPTPKKHLGKAQRVVWFGYKQNALLMQIYIPLIERLGLELMVISNEDPMMQRWADFPEEFEPKYSFKKYDQETILTDLQESDICLLPIGNRPVDRFKSDNKTTLAWLASLPVAKDGDSLIKLVDADERQKEVDDRFSFSVDNYDCRKSVEEMKAFIQEIGR